MKKVLFGAVIACAVMLVACGGDKGKVRMGSLSGDFDSLSYSFGANIGYGMSRQMKDIPFDFARLEKGIEDGALMENAPIDREKVTEMLRNFFMNKFRPRMMELMQQRAAADSVRMAAGDSTKMEYPADSSMFANAAERDSISYAIGLDMANSLKELDAPLQIVWIQEAMKDVREGKAKMDEQQVGQYLQYYFMVKRPAQNAEESKAWLEKIEKKSGVKKTESGLLYKIENKGDETVMAKNDQDKVFVHYKGMTRTGKVFDASRLADMPKEKQEWIKNSMPDYKDEPTPFALRNVIKGWAEGAKLVGKGGKVTLWIPSELAYGTSGNMGGIGPNEALQFEIEVVNVEPYVEVPAVATDSLQTIAPAPVK